MKVSLVSVALKGDSVVVQTAITFMADDVFEMTDAVTQAFLDAASRSVHLAGELVAGYVETESERPLAPPLASPKSQRSRRGKSASPAAASDQSTPSDAPPTEGAETSNSSVDTSPVGGRRRSRFAEPAPVDAPAAEPAKGQRAARPTSKCTPAPEAPVSGAGATGGRRSRVAPAAVAQSPSSAKITDSDLSKACSEAAGQSVPLPEIKKLIATFNVDSVGKLHDDSRPQFLELLQKLVEKRRGS